MVIGPAELERRIQEEEKETLKHLENYIDHYLVYNYDGSGRVCVPLGDAGNNIREYVLKKSLAKYHRVGWRTKIESDQREGTWVEFNRKPGRRRKESPGNSYDPRENCSSYDNDR